MGDDTGEAAEDDADEAAAAAAVAARVLISCGCITFALAGSGAAAASDAPPICATSMSKFMTTRRSLENSDAEGEGKWREKGLVAVGIQSQRQRRAAG